MAGWDEWSKFGLSEPESLEWQAWIERRTALVLSATSAWGSGVFVRDESGATSLLTASHVVVPAALSGELTVLAVGAVPTHSVAPTAIWVHDRADIARIVMDLPPGAEALEYGKEWCFDPSDPPRRGDLVVASGAPGAWKGAVDSAARVVGPSRMLHYWTGVVGQERVGTDDAVRLDVDETDAALPDTFRGMSGGPAIARGRRLVGILKAERRRETAEIGAMFCVPTGRARQLFVPFGQPPSWPRDLVMTPCVLAYPVEHPKSGWVGRVEVHSEWWRSQATPDADGGRLGRLRGVFVGHGALQLVMNVERVFDYPSDAEEDMLNMLRFECDMFLQALGLRPRRDDGERS